MAAAAGFEPAADDEAAPAIVRRGHGAPQKPAARSTASLALASPVGFLAPLISLLPPSSLATFRSLNKAARDHVAAHAFETPLFALKPKALPSWHAACPSAVAVKLAPTASWKSLKPSELAALKAHTVLDMSGCVSLPMATLSRLTSLTALNASNCPQLSNAVFSSLKDLVTLNMSGCAQLTDDALKALKGARGLRELDISGCTQVTAAGLKALGPEVLGQLTCLKAAGCTGLAADAAPLLLKCTRARTLLLTRCSLPLLVATIVAAPPGSRLAVAATMALAALPLVISDSSTSSAGGTKSRRGKATAAAAGKDEEDEGEGEEDEDDEGSGAAAANGGYGDGAAAGGATSTGSSFIGACDRRLSAAATTSGAPSLTALFQAAAPYISSSAPLALAVTRIASSAFTSPAGRLRSPYTVKGQILSYYKVSKVLDEAAAAQALDAAVGAMLGGGGLPILLTAVAAHPDFGPLAEEAAVILFSVAKASPAALEQVIASGGMTALARLLNTHALPPALRTEVCDWLRDKVDAVPSVKAALIAAGGVEGVVWVKPPVEHDVPRFGPPYTIAEDVFSLPIGALRPLMACFSTPETRELRLVSTDVQAHVTGHPWADMSTKVRNLHAWRTAFPRAVGVHLSRVSDLAQATYLEGVTHLSLKDLPLYPSYDRLLSHGASLWPSISALKLVALDLTALDVASLTEAHLITLAPTLRRLVIDRVTGAGSLRLAPLSRLTHLSLNGTATTDGALTGLKSLQELNISFTYLTGTALPALATTLRVLNASNCQGLRDAVLAQLIALEELDIEASSSITAAGLSPLKSLKVLKAAYVRNLTDAAFVGKLSLTTVQVSGCSRLTDAAFAAFGSVTDLKMKGVNTPAVTDAAFVHLGSVRRLVMRDCTLPAVTDAGLSQCANLRELDVAHCTQPGFTGACFAAMPHLTKLDISGCYQLGDAALEAASAALQELNMSSSNSYGASQALSFTEAGFAHLTRLVTLRMDKCMFGPGFTAAAFGHLKSLRVLDARNVLVLNDDALEAMRGRLRQLTMSGCTNVTSAGIKHLSGVVELDMSGCMQDTIKPTAFRYLVGVQRLVTRTGNVLKSPTHAQISTASKLPKKKNEHRSWYARFR